MGKPWSDDAVRRLTDWTRCPRCDSSNIRDGLCVNCGAELASDVAVQLSAASAEAAGALNRRQALLDQLPVRVPITPPKTPEPAQAIPRAYAATDGDAARATSSSQVTVQSILSVAGAGLFAVAAIVFTFFNPDLTDFAVRTTIIAVITLVFIGGAWLFARIGLQFSAETIGALGYVFIILDIWAFASHAPKGISFQLYAGIGTLVSSIVMIALARQARVRTWLWAGLVGAAIAPGLFGDAVGTRWWAAAGVAAIDLAAVGTFMVATRLGPRFASAMRADRATATIIQIVAIIVTFVLIFRLDAPSNQVRVFWSAEFLVALAFIAALSTRNQIASLWSYLAGFLFVAAMAVLPLAIMVDDSAWQFALVPAAAAAATTLLAVLERAATPKPTDTLVGYLLIIGGWTVALAAVIPSTFPGLAEFIFPLANWITATLGLAATLAFLAGAAGSFALSRLCRSRALSTAAFAIGTWLAVLALINFVDWSAFAHVTRVALALAAAVLLAAAVWLAPIVKQRPRWLRVPLIVGVHLLIWVAAVIAWSEQTLSVVGGAAVVLAIAIAAQCIPAKARFIHVAIGYAYALVIFAHALNLEHLAPIAVLCLTTTLAAAFALVVTLVRKLGARFWYAVLAVTAVPFLIGVASVLVERSGWTGLSTGVTFLLLVTLLGTRRPGLNRFLRAVSAALLVPSLAVVAVCIGSQFLKQSGSPVVLPIIAVIVALTLPSTALIHRALVSRAVPDNHASDVRLWLEISSLVTAAIAVLLALTLPATGLRTGLLVLVILGLGTTATRLVTRRTYISIFIWATWTGALWCFLALQGVSVLEPYTLPPALAAAVVGAIIVARSGRGLSYYTVGLSVSVAPSLWLLAFTGNGPDGPLLWRTDGLMAGGILLLLLGAFVARIRDDSRYRKLSRLRVPTLFVAIASASAGSIQAIRFAWSVDESWTVDRQLIMIPVLVFSIAAALVASAAAGQLSINSRAAGPRFGSIEPTRSSRSRWLFAPAAIYLVAGPIAAVRPGWIPIWTLWGLMVALLIVMLFTVLRGRSRSTTLPPVWFTFAVAWITGVVGWSLRDLRVEAFSLPLGLALLGAGIIVLRTPTDPAAAPARRINSWPVGFVGSWRTLTPGLVVLFSASLASTGTDPQTWRAILVIGMALVAILIGSLRRLGAPFIIGIIVLPIENIIVFAVQIGHKIGATPWWISLATAGAVLFIIAVTYERRGKRAEGGIGARLRDLR